MVFAATNAALHDVAISVPRVAVAVATFATLPFALAATTVISTAASARVALNVTADPTGSLSNMTAPGTLVLTIPPIDRLKLL